MKNSIYIIIITFVFISCLALPKAKRIVVSYKSNCMLHNVPDVVLILNNIKIAHLGFIVYEVNNFVKTLKI